MGATTQSIIATLQETIAGLIYMSETDAQFEIVRWTGETDPLSDARIRGLAGHDPGAPLNSAAPAEKFFQDLIRAQDMTDEEGREVAGKYETLLKIFRDDLTGSKIIRLGKIQIDLYVLGRSAEGDWIGLKTKAVET